jgi:molybdate transport system substrate-binding protein
VKRSLLGVLLVAALLAGACGEDSGGGSGGRSSAAGSSDARPTLTVAAAASLKAAFTAYGREFEDATARFSFAGSDELAAQIRQGVTPDLFAAANTKLPEQLHDEGLVSEPTVFAGNRLVLAVPADGSGVRSLQDAGNDGVTVGVGSESVPIGSYTRAVLDRLPARREQAILANVRTEEPDVAGIVGKLTQGAVDAGFVYASDVRGTDGKLHAIELPDDVQPSVAYGVAVVEDADNPEQAQAFIDGLLSGAGQRALEAAGFEPPPGE